MSNKNPYDFHGMDCGDDQYQLQGTCPFCGSVDKWYADPESLMWDCKEGTCMRSGNLYTFLAELVDASLGNTTLDDYQKLSESRGIYVATLKSFKVCRSVLTDDWLLPTIQRKRGKDGRTRSVVLNVHRWADFGDDKMIMMSTPRCKTHMLRHPNAPSSSETVYVAEGHWDAMRLHQTIKTLGLKDITYFGVPGCNIWKDTFNEFCAGKRVNILYDNDEAGKTGADKVITKLAGLVQPPVEVQVLRWPEGSPEKYDYRDLLNDHNQNDETSWAFIQNNLKLANMPDAVTRLAQEEVEPLPCDSFEELCERFRETGMNMPQITRDAMAVLLATILAIQYPGGDMVWLYLVGPAGTGKTTLLLPSTGIAETKFISKFTGLHSGQKSKDGKDHSLINELRNGVLMVKDWTTILTQSGKEGIYGELRDLFDGSSASYYRNNVRNEYKNLNTGIIGCTTGEIYKENMSSLGERFLQCRMWDEGDSNRKDQILASIRSTRDQIRSVEPDSSILLRKRYTLGFMNSVKEKYKEGLPTVSEDYEMQIASCADVISRCRSCVERDSRSEEIIYQPEAEVGTRLGSQLYKLTACLTAIFKKTECDDEVYRLTKKISRDTAPHYEMSIVNLLGTQNEWLTKDQIREHHTVRLASTSAQRRINDLLELKLLRRGMRANGATSGRNVHLFRLTEEFQDTWDLAEL